MNSATADLAVDVRDLRVRRGGKLVLPGISVAIPTRLVMGLLGPVIGETNVIVLGGEAHRAKRKLLMPPFHGARMRAYGALIEAATAAGLHKLTSRVFPENAASRALLKGFGFAEIGTHRRHGKLHGVWRDCVIVERLLDPGSAEDPG